MLWNSRTCGRNSTLRGQRTEMKSEVLSLRGQNTNLLHEINSQFEDFWMKIKTLEREKVDMRKEVEAKKRENRDIGSQVWGLRWQNIKLRRELGSQSEGHSAKRAFQGEQVDGKETRATIGEFFSTRSQNVDFRHELELARQREVDLDIYHEHQKQEFYAIKDKLNRQLKERTTELHSAHLFINQADSLSGAEVVAIANALNTEILQHAALMADSLDYTGTREQPQMSEAAEQVRLWIGEDLAQALSSEEIPHNEQISDPTLVQLVLQVCLVQCCKAIVKSWTLTGDVRILKEVYKRIFARDKQSVAGRWRSMTQAYATRRASQPRVLQWITENIAGVLFITNCSLQSTKSLPDSFHEGLSDINSLAFWLRTAIGEQVTSMDIIPVVVIPGSAFAPDSMDDTYAEGGKNSTAERVAGCTELGLVRRVKVTGSNQETTLLKPRWSFAPP